MAGKRERQNGTWEYVFKGKGLLLEPVYFTFDSEAEGDAYALRAEEQLAKGVVPAEMRGGRVRTLGGRCELYEVDVTMVPSELALLPVIRKAVDSVRTENFDYSWVERWVGGHARGWEGSQHHYEARQRSGAGGGLGHAQKKKKTGVLGGESAAPVTEGLWQQRVR